jgi:hypothetical protein
MTPIRAGVGLSRASIAFWQNGINSLDNLTAISQTSAFTDRNFCGGTPQIYCVTFSPLKVSDRHGVSKNPSKNCRKRFIWFSVYPLLKDFGSHAAQPARAIGF